MFCFQANKMNDCSQTADIGRTDFHSLACAISHRLFCLCFHISEPLGETRAERSFFERDQLNSLPQRTDRIIVGGELNSGYETINTYCMTSSILMDYVGEMSSPRELKCQLGGQSTAARCANTESMWTRQVGISIPDSLVNWRWSNQVWNH